MTRLIRGAAAAAAILALTACTTHLARYTPPGAASSAATSPSATATGGASRSRRAPSGLTPAAATLQAGARRLLDHYAVPSTLPTSALAILDQASAEGYVAIRDASQRHAAYLLASTGALTAALAARAAPFAGGIAYGPKAAAPANVAVTAEAGNALIDAFLALRRPALLSNISAAVRALMGNVNQWLPAQPETVGAEATRAQIGLFLERAADIDVSATSTGFGPARPNHRELIDQRATAALALGGAATLMWPAPPGHPSAPALISLLALTAPAARTASPGVTGSVVPRLATVQNMFTPSGQPTGPPATACVALAALAPGTSGARTAVLWAVRHQRADGTIPPATPGDSFSQALCALSIERQVSVLQRGIVPQP